MNQNMQEKQIYLHGLGQNPTYQNLYAAFSAMCDEIDEEYNETSM